MLNKMKALVLGSSGMLGNAVTRVLSEDEGLEVWGAVRSAGAKAYFDEGIRERICVGVDVEHQDGLLELFADIKPDIVVNCVGLVKQLEQAEDPLQAIPINALLPHRLARLSALSGARLIHMSTDCVFSGRRGMYTEDDPADASDLYGRSKYMGEVDYPHAVTLRTSIIGHELNGQRSLLNWFLSREGSVKGYTRAIFSGLPTVELARIIRDIVIPRPELRGVYHVSAEAISKHDLLKLIAERYGKQIAIVPDSEVVIDRSLNSERFRAATGYLAPSWSELIDRMHAYQ